jgi:DNA replication initiation complex subunit (GINS family)
MGEEIRITYETLFDLVRREKSREELQKLEPSFLADVEAYLTEKRSIASGPNESFFSDDERQKTLLQLSNSCKLLRELYERRERKILMVALVKTRAEKALIDTSSMLEHEKALFNRLTEVLSQQRRDILEPLASAGGHAGFPNAAKTSQEPKSQALKTASQPSVTIEFLADVPKFVGRSLEIYGPYAPGQRAMLPADIAQILIDKGRAKHADALPAEETSGSEQAESPG